jgi:hypothetical protein
MCSRYRPENKKLILFLFFIISIKSKYKHIKILILLVTLFQLFLAVYNCIFELNLFLYSFEVVIKDTFLNLLAK